MGTINLSNNKNRDAVVNTESVRTPLRVRWLDEKGRQSQTVRMLRCTIDRDCDELTKQAGGLEKVADLLLKGDPEIDLEQYGRFLADTSRVYIDPDKKVVRKVQEWEVVRNVDGSERERRPRRVAIPNTSTEVPLKWTGKLMKKAEVYNKFVFAAKMQIVHVNGLTYDFLYGMAKELEAQNSLMLMGAGAKSNLPLVFHRGGVPYRGFLEGRTEGDKYCLILHLSNMELKAPEAPPAPPAAAAAEAPKPESKPEPAPAAKPAEPAPAEEPKAEKPEKPEKKKGRGKKA
ncbi:MAG: hypothetical protein KIS92_16975 [Planctomycetota bacterium]|nr:hypothetical protein [Planctomycetota bacterium]